MLLKIKNKGGHNSTTFSASLVDVTDTKVIQDLQKEYDEIGKDFEKPFNALEMQQVEMVFKKGKI